MKKQLFFLLLLIVFPGYVLANPKDSNSDLCGNHWYGDLDFRISLLGYTLCCDRGGQTCSFYAIYHKGTNVFSKHITLDFYQEDEPQNPKEVVNREVGIEGLDSKIIVHECADHKTWLRIVRRKEGALRVYQYTKNTTLKFDNYNDWQTKDVPLQEITHTFCKLNPFAVSSSAQTVDSVSSTSNTENEIPTPQTQPIVPRTNQEPLIPTNAPADSASRKVFDAVFYPLPVPGNLHTVRHFHTADKQQELKINFSSGDKSNFLQKLEKQFPKESSKVTYCNNGNILFETQQDVYQAFILSPNAVTVFAYPAGLAGGDPGKKQLCTFNAALFW